MLLAGNGIIPPEEWYHDPALRDTDKETVATLLARNGITIPSEWKH